jgi:hypothetical protein
MTLQNSYSFVDGNNTIHSFRLYIDFKLGDFIVWVKKKSQEKNRFKSLSNIQSCSTLVTLEVKAIINYCKV